MDPPHLLPPFAELLTKKDYSAYLRLLTKKGIDWWLDFQFPCIGQHLAPLVHFIPREDARSARLHFLTLCVSQRPSLRELDALFHTFCTAQDTNAACACIGLALNSIWESGREFDRSAVWNKRAKQLWNSGTISPLAHSALLLHFCFGEIAASGDVAGVYGHLATILTLAEEAESPSIFLMYSALGAYIYCWKADFAAFEIILDDTDPFLTAKNASPVAVMQHMISRGLFALLQGRPQEGQAIFETLLAAPNLEQMPPSMWLLLHGHYLYCLVSSEDKQGIKKLADKLRAKAIPEHNQYFHAYLHFNLGIASLSHARPHKTLLHSNEALRLGSLCSSANAIRMSALLHGQALADLEQYDDALACFSKWIPRWRESDYLFLAALACVEVAYIHLKQGNVDKARSSLRNGYRLIPTQEKILPIYRPADYVTRLEQTLGNTRTADIKECDKPIKITTLGNFSVTVDGRIIDEQQWKGRQSKKLLQAIISLGGRNISTSYLAELLWPDADGDRAANSFKVCLCRLRKAVNNGGLNFPWLVVKQKEISLASSFCSVDVYLFEKEISKVFTQTLNPPDISYALSLYTGNFLEIESDEGWHTRKRDDLCEYFIQASQLLFDHYKANNALQTGIPYLIRALKHDPLNEDLLLQVMECHLAMGNKTRALELYNSACRSLKKKHNVDPGKPLRALALKAHAQM